MKDVLDAPTGPGDAQRARLRAGRLAVGVGLAVFGGKLLAYLVTGSNAIFADAMESTVNVVAAAMMYFALVLAAKPPDHDHPYGHGRVEFLSAAIEGTAIAIAALLILAASVRDLLRGPEIASLDLGMALTLAFTLANLLLGRHLVRVGEATRSLALVADGRHILTDVWTSGGVIVGLGIVRVTGWVWADPLIAIVLALNVVREGVLLLRHAVGGLMDRVDDETLDGVVDDIARQRDPAWIDAHGLRTWRSGSRLHVDFHLTVPRYFDVERIHAIHDRIEKALFGAETSAGDLVVHFDPCDASYCRRCPMPDCPIREAAHAQSVELDRDRFTREDPAGHGFGPRPGSA